MLSGSALNAAVTQLVAISRPLHTVYQRAMPHKYASDPLGKMRHIRPARFNLGDRISHGKLVPGARVLYLGDDAVTCLYEAQLVGLPARAVTVVPVECRLAAVVDLRLSRVQKLLRTTGAEVNANFRTFSPAHAPSQMLGETCSAIGRIDGLLYASSARPGHHNLAVFERALSLLHSMLIVSDPASGLSDRLP
ncbi:MAG: RES family NAD+ phosphorylase [Acidobacteriota bacterium]